MSRGRSTNELMFIKCLEDEKFHARAEGLCCYLGERLRKKDVVKGRGKLLQSSSLEPLGLRRQPGFARVAGAGACLGRSPGCPFVQSRADLNRLCGSDFIFPVAGGAGEMVLEWSLPSRLRSSRLGQ